MSSKQLALVSFLSIMGCTKINTTDRHQFITYAAQLAELEHKLDQFNQCQSPRNKEKLKSMFPKSPTAKVKRVKQAKEHKK